MVAKVRVKKISPSSKSSSPRPSKAFGSLLPQHKRRRTEVVPFGPTVPCPSDSVNDVSFAVSAIPPRHQGPLAGQAEELTFLQTFGLLGPPMLVMVLGCMLWTSWLIVLSVAPNAAANFLMNTSEFDNGQFWLIPDEWSSLQLFSVAGLLLVLVFYFYILLKMLVWRSTKNAMQNTMDKVCTYWKTAASAKPSGSLWNRAFHKGFSVSWSVYQLWKAFTSINGKYRKFWNVLLKLHDCVMLSFLLQDQLEAGTPTNIVYGFAVIAASNALSCAAGIISQRSTALAEILVDSLFDFAATVIYPLSDLSYCSENFHYDRAVYLISMELLPSGSFERRARMYANPAEIALVQNSFDSLRILNYTDFFLRISMNLAFSYRCKRIVEVLIDVKVRHVRHKNTNPNKLSLAQPMYFSFSTSHTRGSSQRHVPRLFAVIFVAYSVGVLVATHKAISCSQAACAAYPECVVFAYRWQHSPFCPCRALVDGNPAPRTYDEWTHPLDATEVVEGLAAAGTLETLQLVNRRLTELPEELRGCHNLHFISLINCATEKLPAWAKDFRQLQYLQIDGKVGSQNLGDLEHDLFSDMPELRYLQLGVQPGMLRLPPLDGAPNLRSIILSRLTNLVDFPAVTHQARLERLELTSCKHLPSLPDLQPVVPLAQFAIFQGAHLCCNGFLGPCNLTNPFCQDAACLEDSALKASPATLQVSEAFSDAVCQPHNALSQSPTPETIKMCDGVPFRQCQFPGAEPGTWVVGMCYNHRMQVLACNPDPAKIQVRRRQIQDGVGAPCDPAVEAWLGCTS